MTSKNLFFKLMKEDIKRKIWAIGLAFLAFFFAMPVFAAMNMSSLQSRMERWIADPVQLGAGVTPQMRYMEILQSNMEETLMMNNLFTIMILVGAAVILGVTGFSWLHSRKKVDFYHSIPVKRELLFTVQYLDSILIVAVTYLFNMLAAMGIFLMNGAETFPMIPAAFITFAAQMAGFILMYSVTTLAVMLTGNFFISILGGIVLWSYGPAVTALAEGMKSLFFQTESYRYSSMEEVMYHSSPISHYIYMIGKLMEQGMDSYDKEGPVLAATFLAGLVISAACLVLYRLRPSESAGKAMAFSVTKAPVKILLVVPVTISMSVLFWNIYDSMGWAVFGFIFGLAVSHCIIEIIYHFEFRKLLANLPHMALCAVLSLAVIGVFRFDLIGFDRYLPREEKLSSAAVSIRELDDWADYGMPVQRTGGSYSWNYLNQESYALDHMFLTDYEAVKAIAEAGIENAETRKKIRFSGNDWNDYYEKDGEEFYWCSMEMCYRLKNGKEVHRAYTVDLRALRKTLDVIYSTKEYKEGAYPVMKISPDDVIGVYAGKNHQIEKLGDTDFAARLLETYKEELTAMTIDERQKTMPVTSLRFLTTAEQDYLKKITAEKRPGFMGEFSVEDMNYVNFYPVYPSFTKTLALIGETGEDVWAGVDLDDVERIEIFSRYYYDHNKESAEYTEEETYEYYEYDETGAVYARDYESIGMRVTISPETPEGKAQIESILAVMVDGNIAELNNLYPMERNVDIRVFLKSVNAGKDPAEKEYSYYMFPVDQIPEVVKKLIRYDEVKVENVPLTF